MARRKKSDVVEVLPEYGAPPFKVGGIYKNRNFGKFTVTKIDPKNINITLVESNQEQVMENEEIFERICHNTYYEEYRRLNNIPERLDKCQD